MRNVLFKISYTLSVLLGIVIILVLYDAGLKHPEPGAAFDAVLWGVGAIAFLFYVLGKYEDKEPRGHRKIDQPPNDN